MKAQNNNSIYTVFYVDFNSNIKVIYYPDYKSIYLVDKDNERIFKNYDELKKYVYKKYDKTIGETLEDNFSNTKTNKNFFLGQNEYNINEIFEEKKTNFCKKYNVNFENEANLNDLFTKKIRGLKNKDLEEFLIESEIPLLLFIESYIYDEYKNRKNLNVAIKTLVEENNIGDKYLMKSICFNSKKFNPIESIRYYFNELLYRNKWIKKGSGFDIKVLMQFVDDDIALVFRN